MSKNNQEIRLSPSSLNLFLECPLCFWLDKVKNIKRPEQPFSTLPRGMDLLIKKYFDKYRSQKKMPPEIEGKVNGVLLEDQILLKRWRNWRSGLTYKDTELNAVLSGALDECFIDGGIYIPVDYKTRGFALKEGSEQYYQNQLNCYTFLLETNGFKHPSFAYLVYYILQDVQENGIVKFTIEPIRVETKPQEALNVFRKAVEVLRGEQPEPPIECGFCSWKKNRKQ